MYTCYTYKVILFHSNINEVHTLNLGILNIHTYFQVHFQHNFIFIVFIEIGVKLLLHRFNSEGAGNNTLYTFIIYAASPSHVFNKCEEIRTFIDSKRCSNLLTAFRIQVWYRKLVNSNNNRVLSRITQSHCQRPQSIS